MPDVGSELMQVPFPEMVERLGVGIAEAQLQLDLVSMRIARMMAGYKDDTDDPFSSADDQGRDPDLLVPFGRDKNNQPQQYSLLELGFTPTFYQFVDTVIELKMSISTQTETESRRSSSRTDVSAKAKVNLFGLSGSASVSVSSVSASFSAKYQYSAEGSSVMRTKLVPVPPPAILEERIRLLINPPDDDAG